MCTGGLFCDFAYTFPARRRGETGIHCAGSQALTEYIWQGIPSTVWGQRDVFTLGSGTLREWLADLRHNDDRFRLTYCLAGGGTRVVFVEEVNRDRGRWL